MTNPKNEQITFRLSKSLKDRIDVAVVKTQRKQSNFLEIAVDYYLGILEKNNYINPKLVGIVEPSQKYTKEQIKQAETDDELRAEILQNCGIPTIQLLYAEIQRKANKNKNKDE